MLLNQISAFFAVIREKVLDLPRILSNFFRNTVELPKHSARPSEQNPALDDDLDGLTFILGGNDSILPPISYILSIEDALGDLAVHASALITYQRQWLSLIDRINAIRGLVRSYYQNLERASNVVDHGCFNHKLDNDDTPNIPDSFANCLRDLRTCLKRVIIVLQRCRNAQKSYFSFFNSSKEISQCSTEVEEVFRTLNDYLLPKNIYEVSLDDISRTRVSLDVMEQATPKRYRLLDCSKLVEHNSLSIFEFDHFPHSPYIAISYVWRGNSVPEEWNGAQFSVKGAEDADPIGIEVLHDACVASLKLNATYLWMDRLCIMQTSKEDKSWQIREMYSMYRSCAACIVVAGGLHRLVRMDEETNWIHRGWTLQEALAPQSVSVLFAWKLGKCVARSGDRKPEQIIEVVPARSAMTSLSLLLDACTTGYLSIEQNGTSSTMVQATMFSAQPSKYSFNDFPFWRPTRRLRPNVSALALAMGDEMDRDEKEYAIWQSALMRTSSRPVDMVFSIMGLFGVSLDTKAFGENDRIKATIALAREILQKGGRANWLGISFRIDPCPYLSIFPTFPRTRVSGKALVRIGNGQYREVSELMENEYPNARALVPLPLGVMNDNGYFDFKAKAIRIRPYGQCPSDETEGLKMPTRLTALDGSVWGVCDGGNAESPSASFAVLLGLFVGYYPGATPAPNERSIRAILVEEHAPGKFRVRSYFMLDFDLRTWVSEWMEHTFSVGGPLSLREEVVMLGLDEPFEEVVIVDKETFMETPFSKPSITLKDKTEMKARWAIPQCTLEKRMAQQN